MKLFSIPNLLTLGNLSCGCLAIVFALEGNLVWTAYLVGIAAVLDFLDGFVARALKQFSPIGKELDSLADMVTFGVVPGVVMFQLLQISFNLDVSQEYGFPAGKSGAHFFAFLITLFSALRLAKFNVDTRQSESFVGVPTPANAILICSLPLILGIEKISRFMSDWHCACPETTEPYLRFLMNDTVLWSITLVMCYLLIAEIPLFALKFKSFAWKGNEIRYSFLGMSLIMVVLLQYIALPLIIVLYVILSIVNNIARRSSSSKNKPAHTPQPD
ncbi:MAG TPA: CDP-diacylglycerol--serine O-phosphatidyltransferase [Bacteroidia bacterium]|nr:CDP-diacylglycerol--serine O-phosphatidyltransferase [Bacteroidia bacterium]